MDSSRLYIFGAPRLEPGGAAITLPTPLAALAAYLVVHGRVARWRLAGAIWPDLSEAQARRMLSTALYRLRRALGEAAPCLRTDGEWVSLDGLGCDIADFRDHAASDQPERWLLALDLYAAEILPDYDTDWLDALRSELHHGYLGLLERMVAEQARRADALAALELAQRWVAADPLNETAHMALMRLYGRLGRYTAALQQFAQLAALLDKELGIAPLPETSALAEQLRRELEVAQSRAAIERQQQRSQPYVGRGAERAAALEALETALAGRAGLLLIAGEAGMGKTRLLDELAAAGVWRGFQIAWGRASGRSAATPYAPLDQALAAAATPALAGALRQQLSPVALEALGGLIPHLRSGEEALSRPSLPAAVSEGLHILSAQTPLLLLLDDVQWASPAFWAACAFTAAQTAALARSPLLIILSYRPSPGVDAAIARFAGRWRASRLTLRGLSQDEVQQLVAQSGDGAGREHSADELAALCAITDGNPLYIQESLAGERRAPQPFRQIIAERMDGLGAAALGALHAAAVLGREWPAALWREIAGQPIDELAAELEAARLIQPSGAGYAFRHDLIHQHVAAAIPPERERALHGRAVERLIDSGAGPERLAWHAERSGDPGAAIGWYRAAAEAALAAFAYSTALEHTERALALLDQAAGDPADRLGLLCVRQRVLGVAVFNGTAWQALATSIDGDVHAVAIHNGEIVVGGEFTTINGVTVNHVARWNGSAWLPLSGPSGAGTDGPVEALASSGGSLYAGGLFTTAGGAPASNIAAWNGSAWRALGGGTNGHVVALRPLSSGLIAVGGRFLAADGNTNARNIALVNGATGAWQALGAGVRDEVRAIEQRGNDIYAGGLFTEVNGLTTPAKNIGRWNGVTWQPLGSGVAGGCCGVQGGGINAMVLLNDRLFVGGDFERAGDKPSVLFGEWNQPEVDLLLKPSDSPDPVGVNNALTYTTRVYNSGNLPAPSTVVTQTIPASFLLANFTTTQGSCSLQAGNTVRCALGTLGDGDSATIQIFVTPSQVGTFNSSIGVVSSAIEPITSNNLRTIATQVTPPGNPAPAISSISPSSFVRQPFSFPPPAPINITVNGSGFVPGSKVRIDGVDAGTTFVSNTRLEFFKSATSNTGGYDITVFNPAPGGGTSNAVELRVTFGLVGVSSVTPNSGGADPGLQTTFVVSWTHTTDQWRVIDHLDLRLVDADGAGIWLRFTEGLSGTFSLLDADGVPIGVAEAGADQVLDNEFAELDVAASSFAGSGPTGFSMRASFVLRFKEAARGDRYNIELYATDDNGDLQGPDVMGEFRVGFKNVYIPLIMK